MHFLQRRCCFFYGFIIHRYPAFVKGFLKIYAINHIYSCSLYLLLLHFHTFMIFYEFCILISCIFLIHFLQIEINVNDTILIASKIKLPCIFSRAVIKSSLGYLYLISLYPDYTAFIISVPRHSRTACHRISVSPQPFCSQD